MEEIVTPAKGNKRSISRILTATVVCGVFGVSLFQLNNKINFYKESFQKKTIFKVLENYKININEIKLNQIANNSLPEVKTNIVKVKNIQSRIAEARLAKANQSNNVFSSVKISAVKKAAENNVEKNIFNKIKTNFVYSLINGIDRNAVLENIANNEKVQLTNILSMRDDRFKYDAELDRPYTIKKEFSNDIGIKNINQVLSAIAKLEKLNSKYKYAKLAASAKPLKVSAINKDLNKNKPHATHAPTLKYKKAIHDYAIFKNTQKIDTQNIKTRIQSIESIQKNIQKNIQRQTVDFQKEIEKTKEIDLKNGFTNAQETIIKETDRIPALENKKFKIEMDPMEILALERVSGDLIAYSNNTSQGATPIASQSMDGQNKNTQEQRNTQGTQDSPHETVGINQKIFLNSFRATDEAAPKGSNIKDYVMLPDASQRTVDNKNVQGNVGPKLNTIDNKNVNTNTNNLADDRTAHMPDDKKLAEGEKPLTIAELIEKFKNESKAKPEETAKTLPEETTKTLNKYYGTINEAFTGAQKPVEGARVQILGTDIAVLTNTSGEFEFSDKIQINGVLPVMITKEGHLNRRADLVFGKISEIELVSNNSVALTAVVLNEAREQMSGFLFAELSSPIGETIESKRVEISGIQHAEVVYINEKGLPDKTLKTTSSRGQFLVLNLKPGNYLINTLDINGTERAPHIIYVGPNEGIIKKVSLGIAVTVKGQILNALNESAKIDGAQVQILGSSKVASSNREGQFEFQNIYIDCPENNYIQIDKSGFYRNRFSINCSNSVQKLFAFPASLVDSISTETESKLSSANAVMLGHVSFNKSVKVQLWGPDEVYANAAARGEDYYYDRDGVLNSAKNRTSSNGNFVIMNAPPGVSYVQAVDKNGKTLSFWPVYLSESTVSVYIQ